MPNPFPLEYEHEMPHFAIEEAWAKLWEQEEENSTTIICENEPWGVKVWWTTSGGTCNALSGKWIIQCSVEAYGQVEGPDLKTYELPLVAEPHSYEQNCEFDAYILKPGAYKLVVTITMMGDNNRPGPFAMLGEGPLFQVYKFPGEPSSPT